MKSKIQNLVLQFYILKFIIDIIYSSWIILLLYEARRGGGMGVEGEKGEGEEGEGRERMREGSF